MGVKKVGIWEIEKKVVIWEIEKKVGIWEIEQIALFCIQIYIYNIYITKTNKQKQNLNKGKSIRLMCLIHFEFVKQNSSLEPLKLKNILVTEAVVGVVTTIDGKLTLPCSVYYEANKKNYDEQHKKSIERVFQLQVCDGCLPH